jgi:phosphopentomutase
MLYGHRNDVEGFARALVRFDETLGNLIGRMTADDLLILSADHGNDPTTPSTDHSREYVPACVIGYAIECSPLGDVDGMTALGATVAAHLNINWPIGHALQRSKAPTL